MNEICINMIIVFMKNRNKSTFKMNLYVFNEIVIIKHCYCAKCIVPCRLPI